MMPYTPELRSTLSNLITANHILAHHSLLDATGHVSVRSPSPSPSPGISNNDNENDNTPESFLITGSPPPALVSRDSDLAHYRILDAEPFLPGDAHSPTTTTHDGSSHNERFVHSEIYKRWPGVKAVVHSHAREVVVAGVSGVPVRVFWDMAGFLGEGGVPVWDLRDEDGENRGEGEMGRREREGKGKGGLLVNSISRGRRLAEAFGRGGEGEVEVDGSAGNGNGNGLPGYTVVLHRGHGFTTWGESLQEAVYRAYYTLENVRVQMAATDHSVVSLGELSTIPLSKEEIRDAAEMNRAFVFKSWALWSRQVEADPMYRNDLSRTNSASDQAQKFWRTAQNNRMLPF